MSEPDVKNDTPRVQADEATEGASFQDSQAPAVAGAENRDAKADLSEQIKTLKDEVNRYHDLYLRERAELDNFRKRTTRERSEAVRFASEPLIRDLLPVVDNLERALAHAEDTQLEDTQLPVLDGVRLVLKSLLEALRRHGVTRVEALGQSFDPNRHEAMAQVESAAHEPNRVVAEHQSGYLLHDRLIRPAMVSVSGPKSKPPVASDPNRD